MRVLHVSPLYWPSLGGGEQVTKMLSERMVRDGHEVTVLCSDAANVERFWDRRAPRVSPREERIDGVRVIRVPVRPFPLGQLGLFVVRGLTIRILAPLRLSKIVRSVGAWMPRMPQMVKTLHELPHEFDLVHGFNLSWESCLVDACEFARARHIAFLATPFIHIGETRNRRVHRNFTMSHQLAALRKSTRVIAQTVGEARALETMGVEAHRVEEVGIGLELARVEGGDAKRFRIKHDIHRPIVAFVGRVTRDKGATMLVRAMQQVWDSGADVHCVIAGLVMPDFKRFLRAQPDATRLHILGPVSETEKLDLLSAADIVAMPSRAESFGIVYLEAWAYSKPVIGARAGGAADVITDGVDGYLLPFDDAASLSGRVIELISDRERAQSMGRAGHSKLLARYTWDKIYDRTMAVYADVLRT